MILVRDRRLDRCSLVLMPVLALVMLADGCTRYHDKPITSSTASEQLAIPDQASVRIATAELRHPLLKPTPVELSRPLDPDQAAVLAVILNPSLRAIRDQRGVASAQVLQAGILPNPQLSASAEIPTAGDVGGTTSGFGLGLNWEATALITRASRRRAAIDQADSIDLSVAWQEWQLAQGTKQIFFRLRSAILRLAIAEEADRFQAHQRDLMTEAVSANLKTSADLAAADASSQDARVLALDLREEVERQRLALTRTLGLPARAEIQTADVPWPSEPSPDEGLERDLELSRIDLVALRMGYDGQQEALRTAILGQFPKVSIGLTHARDTGNVQASGIGITIDLPIFDRNQGAIASETATRQRLFDEYVQRVYEARHDLAEALSEAAAVAERIRETDRTLDSYRKREAEFRSAVGDSLLDVLSLQQAVTALTLKRLEAIQLRERLAEVRIAIELAAGRYLPVAVSATNPASDPAPNPAPSPESTDPTKVTP